MPQDIEKSIEGDEMVRDGDGRRMREAQFTAIRVHTGCGGPMPPVHVRTPRLASLDPGLYLDSCESRERLRTSSTLHSSHRTTYDCRRLRDTMKFLTLFALVLAPLCAMGSVVLQENNQFDNDTPVRKMDGWEWTDCGMYQE